MGEEDTSGFGDVLEALKADGTKKFSRKGWNGIHQFIGRQDPDKNSANTLPYLYFTTTESERVPWVASQTDLLGEDWFEVEE